MSMKTLCTAITSSRHPIRLAGVMATALAVSSVSGVAVAAGLGQSAGTAPPATPTTDKKLDQDKKPKTLQSITVTVYVSSESNAAAKMQVPLIETPQSLADIPRAQMDLLDWQSLDQVVRYTTGVVGSIDQDAPRPFHRRSGNLPIRELYGAYRPATEHGKP